MLFKISELNSTIPLTLGYLNPALHNSAQDATELEWGYVPSQEMKEENFAM